MQGRSWDYINIHIQEHFHIITFQQGNTMAWHLTLVLGTLVLIIAQSLPSLVASSRWTLEKQQLHHDGRAVGSDHLPLDLPPMVEESKRRSILVPPSPQSSPVPLPRHN
ncbi:hypothetical protein MRB53_029377 [Persea americana]|uniref:Uncharacterized protein n=1 Tax=Persea americana TaxID=3435 RepID=A0ACC2KIV6_PERAE|nr:hypothetical protein MRB53_029377 [Persea americana]